MPDEENTYGRNKDITIEFLWGHGGANIRLDVPPRHVMSMKDARDFAYNIIDRMVQAPNVDQDDLERCDTCHDFGSDFIPFINPKGDRSMVCRACAHAIAFSKRRESSQ